MSYFKNNCIVTSLAVQGFNFLPSNAGGVVSIPVWELRSHMFHGQKKNTETENRINTATNSRKI